MQLKTVDGLSTINASSVNTSTINPTDQYHTLYVNDAVNAGSTYISGGSIYCTDLICDSVIYSQDAQLFSLTVFSPCTLVFGCNSSADLIQPRYDLEVSRGTTTQSINNNSESVVSFTTKLNGTMD